MPIVLFTLLWALSCIDAPYPKELLLQHVPTLFMLAGLVVARRRGWVSPASVSLVLLFMMLHLLGARYLYSYVPYDDWSYWLLDERISDRFGFTRNHYDRVVHFAFGLLLVYPAREFLDRQWPIVGPTSGWLAFQFILASSALYEIGEWAIAVTLAPDWAEHYNGQQGDMWDAQKDMALAAAGAVAALALMRMPNLRLSLAKRTKGNVSIRIR